MLEYECNGSNWVQLGQDIDGELAQTFGWDVDMNTSEIEL